MKNNPKKKQERITQPQIPGTPEPWCSFFLLSNGFTYKPSSPAPHPEKTGSPDIKMPLFSALQRQQSPASPGAGQRWSPAHLCPRCAPGARTGLQLPGTPLTAPLQKRSPPAINGCLNRGDGHGRCQYTKKKGQNWLLPARQSTRGASLLERHRGSPGTTGSACS